MKQKQEKRARRKRSPEEKTTILLRHFVEQVPVSEPCDEYRNQPSLFYVWHSQMWENLGLALENGNRGQVSTKEESLHKRIHVLEETLS